MVVRKFIPDKEYDYPESTGDEEKFYDWSEKYGPALKRIIESKSKSTIQKVQEIFKLLELGK